MSLIQEPRFRRRMSADGQAVAFANAAEALAAPAEDVSSLLHICENWVFTKFQLTEV